MEMRVRCEWSWFYKCLTPIDPPWRFLYSGTQYRFVDVVMFGATPYGLTDAGVIVNLVHDRPVVNPSIPLPPFKKVVLLDTLNGGIFMALTHQGEIYQIDHRHRSKSKVYHPEGEVRKYIDIESGDSHEFCAVSDRGEAFGGSSTHSVKLPFPQMSQCKPLSVGNYCGITSSLETVCINTGTLRPIEVPSSIHQTPEGTAAAAERDRIRCNYQLIGTPDIVGAPDVDSLFVEILEPVLKRKGWTRVRSKADAAGVITLTGARRGIFQRNQVKVRVETPVDMWVSRDACADFVANKFGDKIYVGCLQMPSSDITDYLELEGRQSLGFAKTIRQMAQYFRSDRFPHCTTPTP